MNKQQLGSLVRSAFKIAGSALIAHGATTAGNLVNSEDIVGLVCAVIGLLASHSTHWNDSSSSSSSSKTSSVILLFALPVLFFSGCTFERLHTVINTPAVYQVSGGVTNLVSPAFKTEVEERDRTYLPLGYALDAVQSGYGIHFAAIDKASGNPGDIRAGMWYSSERWTPTATNQLYAPRLTSSGTFGNSLPFTLRGSTAFTSGEAEVNTNSSGAIVPGTPNSQHP